MHLGGLLHGEFQPGYVNRAENFNDCWGGGVRLRDKMISFNFSLVF